MKLMVTANTGCRIAGYGTRLKGEVFDLPDGVAKIILRTNPEPFRQVSSIPTLCSIKGIGDKMEITLAQSAAIFNLFELLAANPGFLADALEGVSERQIEDWQEQAKVLMEGVENDKV